MAGIIVRYHPTSASPSINLDAGLVNLAPYFVTDRRRRGLVELQWSRSPDGRHCFEIFEQNRWLLLEGNPDRLPNCDEPLSNWLTGRWGSYRGVEIQWNGPNNIPLITAFVDPWASRPLYHCSDGDGLIISDKLATIAVNRKNAEVDWAAVLEAMLCGSVYSGGVSLKHTTAFRPGEAIRFVGSRYQESTKYPIPADPEITADIVHANPSSALRTALAKSVGDTWRDPDAFLFLTGGLDSRFILTLGGAVRRAAHLFLYPKDAEYARQIAAAADCELREFDLLDGHYVRVMEQAYLPHISFLNFVQVIV